jgi:DNA uptake protein ComE-like DNA-binding protein
MFSTPVENLVVRHSAARFAGSQGYRLEGDQAHLNAAVAVEDARLAGADWALQLWACDRSAVPGSLQGIKVAEVPVGRLPAQGAASLDGWGTALPPAGQRAHTMVLALASGREGLYDRIHDLAVFPIQESFRQPSMQGMVGYRFDQASVDLRVGAVVNPRDEANLSGSLSLELWALPRTYLGGAFEGFRIAGADLGCVPGQSSMDAIHLTLPAAPVPAGTWQIVLMLREWTPAGFVTRDYANFVAPHVVAEPAPPAVAVEAAPAVPVAAEPAKAQPGPAQAGEPPQAKGAPAASARQAAGSVPAQAGRVSINRASVAELAAIKGLGKTVAAAIVAARPYADLEELLRAKGMGPKLLAKLREHLAL